MKQLLILLTTWSAVSAYGMFKINAWARTDCTLNVTLGNHTQLLHLAHLLPATAIFTPPNTNHNMTLYLSIYNTSIPEQNITVFTYANTPTRRFFFDGYDATIHVRHECETVKDPHGCWEMRKMHQQSLYRDPTEGEYHGWVLEEMMPEMEEEEEEKETPEWQIVIIAILVFATCLFVAIILIGFATILYIRHRDAQEDDQFQFLNAIDFRDHTDLKLAMERWSFEV